MKKIINSNWIREKDIELIVNSRKRKCIESEFTKDKVNSIWIHEKDKAFWNLIRETDSELNLNL